MASGWSNSPAEAQDYSFQQWQRSYAPPRPGELSPGEAALEFFGEYARQRPEVVAMWAFGIGFMLGWKLKPW